MFGPGAVIPALGSGRYAPGPNIVLPSWLKGSDPNFTINGFWGQPGALATVSNSVGIQLLCKADGVLNFLPRLGRTADDIVGVRPNPKLPRPAEGLPASL